MRQLTLLIVDDEPPARHLLREHAAGRADLRLVGEAEDGPAALEAIASVKPDVVLLDVEMPGQDGFGVLAKARERGLAIPRVVFATAFDRYAVKAFEVNAVDYLLKPIARARFDEAIDRCLSRAGARQREPDLHALLEDTWRLPPQRLLVRERGRVIPVSLDAIDWLEAQGDYVCIHTRGRSHLIERTLTQMEAVLKPLGFARIHRGAIVNLSRMREIHAEGSGRYSVVLLDGSVLSVSRSYGSVFHRTLL